MAIRVFCSCGKTLRVSADHAGKRFKCPNCGTLHFASSTPAQAAAGDRRTWFLASGALALGLVLTAGALLWFSKKGEPSADEQANGTASDGANVILEIPAKPKVSTLPFQAGPVDEKKPANEETLVAPAPPQVVAVGGEPPELRGGASLSLRFEAKNSKGETLTAQYRTKPDEEWRSASDVVRFPDLQPGMFILEMRTVDRKGRCSEIARRSWTIREPVLPPGEILRFGSEKDTIWALALSPDGRHVAVAGYRQEVAHAAGVALLQVRDTATGKHVRTFVGHKGIWLKTVAFSGDGKYLLSGGGDFADGYSLRLWEVETGKQVRSFWGQADARCVAFTPDGRFILSAGSGGVGPKDFNVRVWDVASGKEVHCMAGHQTPVNALAVSPDGRYVLSGAGGLDKALVRSVDCTVRLWDLRTGKQIRCLEHKSPVIAVAFSGDGKLGFSATFGDIAQVWNLETGGEARRLSLRTESVAAAAFTPDGKRLLRYGEPAGRFRVPTFWLYDVAGGAPAGIFEDYCRGVKDNGLKRVAAVGDLAATSAGEGWVVLWRLPGADKTLESPPPKYYAIGGPQKYTREKQMLTGHTARVTGAAFTPDGTQILTCAEDGTVRLWDARTGKELRRFPRRCWNLAFAPDGRIVISSEDHSVTLWDFKTGEELRRVKSEGGSAGFIADGDRFYSFDGVSRLFHIWDVNTGRELRRLTLPEDFYLSRLSVTKDGRRLVNAPFMADIDAPQKNRMLLWDIERDRELRSFPRLDSLSVHSVAISPDEKFALTGAHRTVRLWDLGTGKQIRELKGHESLVQSVQFSPDGRRALTAGMDQTARLWDIETGKELYRIVGRAWLIAAFSPDGRHVLTIGTGEKEVRVFELPE